MKLHGEKLTLIFE